MFEEVARDLLPLLTKLVITLLDSILCNMTFEYSHSEVFLFPETVPTNKATMDCSWVC